MRYFFRKSLISTFSQLIGRVANFVLPLLFLARFGASETTDALFLAFAIIFFFGGTLSNAASDAFIPSLSNEYRSRPSREWLQLIFVLSSISFFLFMVFSHEINHYTLLLSLVSFLLVFVGLFSSLYVSELYYSGDYYTPGITWSFRWIALIPIFLLDDVAVASSTFLSLILFADIARLFILVRVVKKGYKQNASNSERTISSELVFWFILSSSLSGLNPLIDRFIASYLGEGSVSQLELVERLASLFLLLPTVGVLQVINVEINKKINSSSGLKCDIYLFWVFISSMVWVSLCVIILWFFDQLLFELFAKEVWSSVEDFSYGLLILIAMAPSLFLGMVAVRILLALNKGQTVMRLSLASLVANTIVSIPIGILLGVNGILLGSIFTYTLTASALVFMCSKYCRISARTP